MFSTNGVVEHRKDILSKIPELVVFRHYLNLPHLQERDYFCNTLRDDSSPTCSFYRTEKNRLVMTDWSGKFKGDCIALVMWAKEMTYSQALTDIWNNLGHGDYKQEFTKKLHKEPKQSNKQTTIFVEKQPWTNESLWFWRQFHIDADTLDRYDVYAIKKLWKNGNLHVNIKYRWNPKFPVFGYYFGKGSWKIYYPKILQRAKSFVSNGPHIQGLRQLESDPPFLVITKSLKDVMVLSLFGIPAIAPSGETAALPEELMHRFYGKTIFTLYDDDETGRLGAKRLQEKYLTVPLFLDTEFENVKDISDLIQVIGKRKLKLELDEGSIFTSSRGSSVRELWRQELQNGYRHLQEPEAFQHPLRESIFRSNWINDQGAYY